MSPPRLKPRGSRHINKPEKLKIKELSERGVAEAYLEDAQGRGIHRALSLETWVDRALSLETKMKWEDFQKKTALKRSKTESDYKNLAEAETASSVEGTPISGDSGKAEDIRKKLFHLTIHKKTAIIPPPTKNNRTPTSGDGSNYVRPLKQTSPVKSTSTKLVQKEEFSHVESIPPTLSGEQKIASSNYEIALNYACSILQILNEKFAKKDEAGVKLLKNSINQDKIDDDSLKANYDFVKEILDVNIFILSSMEKHTKTEIDEVLKSLNDFQKSYSNALKEKQESPSTPRLTEEEYLKEESGIKFRK